MAVIEKRLNLRLGDMDVYINVAGGVRVHEPALDLGIALAVVSALRDAPLPPGAVVFGEVGLAGELRSVTHGERRAIEAMRLGFDQCVLPQSSASRLKEIKGEMKVSGASTLRAAVEALLPEALRGRQNESRNENRSFKRSKRDGSTPAEDDGFSRALVNARSNKTRLESGEESYSENEGDALFDGNNFDDTAL